MHRIFAFFIVCALVFGGCKSTADDTASTSNQPKSTPFQKLDEARTKQLQAQSTQIVGALFSGKCEDAEKAAHIPFGYGRRDRRTKQQKPALDLLNARQFKELCVTLGGKGVQPPLHFERADHLEVGQWEVQEMKTLMPEGADRLTFAIGAPNKKDGEGVEVYFDREGRCIGLIEEVR